MRKSEKKKWDGRTRRGRINRAILRLNDLIIECLYDHAEIASELSLIKMDILGVKYRKKGKKNA